jgi:signal transduction histidine kinase
LVALLGVATLSGLVIWLGGVVMVGKPLNQLIDKVHRAGEGDFTGPLQLDSRDELGKLGSALNQMCDQLANQRSELEAESASRIAAVEQLRHAERLNTVGRMAAGIAHEVGTPLSVVTGRAELIASGKMSDEQTCQSARAIQHEAQRITKIVRELLDFARQSTPTRSRQCLNELIDSTVKLVGPLTSKRDAVLTVQLPPVSLYAEVDPAQIQQVLTNLIVNATQATESGGQVTVSLAQVMVAQDDSPQDQRAYQRISIQDNGLGISDEDRQHIFEPFFTTKDVGEGTGLGLSISHGIVQEHQGWIDVQSQPGAGSCFSIFLPASQPSQEVDQHQEAVQ